MIGADWKILVKNLKIDKYVSEEISNENNMMQCFEQAGNEIYWKGLKYQLEKMGRQDILDEIAIKTCCTHGNKNF